MWLGNMGIVDEKLTLIDMLQADYKKKSKECHDVYNTLLSLCDCLFKYPETSDKAMDKLFLKNYIFDDKSL